MAGACSVLFLPSFVVEYDSWGRLTRTIGPDDGSIEEYGYDPAGNMISYQDQNHSSANVLYDYDHMGRLVSVLQLQTPPDDSPYIETSYGYDQHGNLTGVTDANGDETTYGIDDFGHTYRIDSPVTGTTEMVYNQAGQMTQRVNALGITETWTYDTAGRPTVVAYSDGSATDQSVTYGYQNGQLVLAETLEGSTVKVRESWVHDRDRGPDSR